MLVFDLRVLLRDFCERPMEQTIGDLHDVVFGEAGDFLSFVRSRVLEGVADDAFASRSRDELKALRYLVCLPVLDPAVDVFLVLANDYDVHLRMLRCHVRIERHTRTDVGVHAQRLADRHVEALESAALRRRDRRFEEDFRPAKRLPGCRLDPVAESFVVNRLADLNALQREPGACGVQDAQRGSHNFRSDAVAVGDRHGRLLHESPMLSWTFATQRRSGTLRTYTGSRRRTNSGTSV